MLDHELGTIGMIKELSKVGSNNATTAADASRKEFSKVAHAAA